MDDGLDRLHRRRRATPPPTPVGSSSRFKSVEPSARRVPIRSSTRLRPATRPWFPAPRLYPTGRSRRTDRWPSNRRSIPIHHSKRQPGHCSIIGDRCSCKADEEHPSIDRRQQRCPEQAGSRPISSSIARRPCPPRNHAPGHRRCAVRRLRRARDRDHLHAAQPVLRRDGRRPRVSGRTRSASRATSTSRPTSGGDGAALGVHSLRQRQPRPLAWSITRASFPSVTYSFNLARQRSAWAGRAGRPHQRRGTRRRRSVDGHRFNFSGTAQAFKRLPCHRAFADRRRHRCGVRGAGDSVRELHSPDHHSLHVAVRGRRARCWLCCLTHTELTVIALIGIILLIGIVKKNAIMMIDFALEVERRDHKSPRVTPCSRPACCASGRS